ncbi:P-loop containing nucleoside triphosphate hydrolase protein [Dipodascopsis uninucleata]
MTSLNDFAEYVESRANSELKARARNVSQLIESELDALESLSLDKPRSEEQKVVPFRECLLAADKADHLQSTLQALLQENGSEYLLSLTNDPINPETRLNLTPEEYDSAVARLKSICDEPELDCEVTEIFASASSRENDPSKPSRTADKQCTKYGAVLVRQKMNTVSDLAEIRVAVVGNVDAGKSTLLGVLTKGGLDDGRGSARVNLFRHKHEVESGRTSSVGMEVIGFDERGRVVGISDGMRRASWKDIVAESRKLISFIDLAGHEKYLKTTIFGLMGGSPDFVMLMVGANAGMIGMAKEHLGVSLALNVPVFICVTKIDMCPQNVLQATVAQLGKILRSSACRKMPLFINSFEDVVEAATSITTQRICPIFQVSNVTGEGLDYVRTFLNLLPHHSEFNESLPFEFEINDTFSVPFVGTVVSGIVTSGTARVGDSVYIGPDSVGQFAVTSIRSIERKRTGVEVARAGQSVSFAIKKIRRRDVRKGMVILPKTEQIPRSIREFVAEVLILQNATTIKVRYQAMLHVGAIAQTCCILDIDRPYIRTGDRATVRFRFMNRPEYIHVGQKLLFREGRTRGLGVVKEIIYGI